jgi:hypothetical protein
VDEKMDDAMEEVSSGSESDGSDSDYTRAVPPRFWMEDEADGTFNVARHHDTVYDKDRIIDDPRGIVTERSVLLTSNDNRTELQIAVDSLVHNQEADPMDVDPSRFDFLDTQTKKDVPVVKQYNNLPVNEFSKNSMLASKCFPTLFPYGTLIVYF